MDKYEKFIKKDINKMDREVSRLCKAAKRSGKKQKKENVKWVLRFN